MSDGNSVAEKTVRLPLDEWHRARGARMVAFAGYEMPIQYSDGIMAEHAWTREQAGLFDVSHMGQLIVSGPDAAEALEALVPGDISSLKPQHIRYSLLLNDDGGIIDDLMVTNVTAAGAPTYYLVVNGATKHGDIAHMRAKLSGSIRLDHMEDRALLALQGPKAAEVIDTIFPGVTDEIVFMRSTSRDWQGAPIGIGRSGYTGEDGFELSVPASHAEQLADALIAHDAVKPIGLGARDSLRLEAGLPLYGHDLDEQTTPVGADLAFAISKARRAEGGFPGAETILSELSEGAAMKRVGLFVEGRQPVREGSVVVDATGQEIGRVTSGGFSPSLERPIAMAYVPADLAQEGQAITLKQRNREFSGTVTAMPFVPHRYARKGKSA